MKYKYNDFTYGLELEYADVYRFDKLPAGNLWNDKDYTIINSSGVANDPTGKLWEYGGEINTRPESSPEKATENVEEINAMLVSKPAINYRCNLHIHIGVVGLKNDIIFLKKLFDYILKFQKVAFELIEPIPKPVRIDFQNIDAYKGAIQRYRRRLVSHQYCIAEKKSVKIMCSKNPKQFFNRHANVGESGELLWFITPRAGINLRQLWETDTIEFRHFPGTLNLDEIHSSLLWCGMFVNAALNTGVSPHSFFSKRHWKFPKFRKYIHEMDLVWRKTNLSKNSRRTVKKNISQLVRGGGILDIDEYRVISNTLESGYSKGFSGWI